MLKRGADVHDGDLERDIINYTISHLGVKAWFEWLEQRRKIFDVREGSNSQAHTILEYQWHTWAQILSSRYLDVLER